MGANKMRVYVYVDGFNLYYRALKATPHKWLDIVALARRLLNPGDTVDMVRYFTARVSSRAGDPDAPRRQQILFNAMETLPEVQIHYGRFLTKTKRRPVVGTKPPRFEEFHDTEEKGSDVNLAVHLVNDGWHKRYDVALVMSQDTDLIEPLRIVSQELGLTVGLIWLDGGQPNRNLSQASTFVRHLRHSDLAACQFPDPVTGTDGLPVNRPTTW
jgi:uncharacterized LabA/DUF88 family protein